MQSIVPSLFCFCGSHTQFTVSLLPSQLHVSDVLILCLGFDKAYVAGREHIVMCNFAICLHCALQILSARQHAIGIVHSYPFIPEKHRVLELLASKRNEPTAEALTQSAEVDDLQHAANWQQIEEYLKTVTAQNMNQYIPLIKDNTSRDPSFASSVTDQPLDPFV